MVAPLTVPRPERCATTIGTELKNLGIKIRAGVHKGEIERAAMASLALSSTWRPG